MADGDKTTQQFDLRWIWAIVGLILLLILARWIYDAATGPSLTAVTPGATSTEMTPGVPNTGTTTDEGTGTTDETATTTTVSGTTTVSAIIQDPNEYNNKVVTVQGSVSRVLDPRLFTIIATETTGGKPLTVVSPRPATLAEADTVTITGKVRSGTLSALLEKIGQRLPINAEDLFGVHAILVADSIQTQI